MFMSPHAAWVTWDLEDPDGDPFHFRTTDCPEEVRANLGLNEANEPLLLLVYKRGDLKLRKPTIADGELNPRFQPPPVGTNLYGLTNPRPCRAGGKRCPEAVHAPARFELICEDKCVLLECDRKGKSHCKPKEEKLNGNG